MNFAADDGTKLAPLYNQQVDRQLDLPEDEQHNYADLMSKTLTQAGNQAQYVVVVDRELPDGQSAWLAVLGIV